MVSDMISAIGSGLSGIGGSIASIINTNKSIKANKQMAEYAYGKDLEMWNKQNQYNSPTAQMERLKQAGLNPNLMYGQGNVGNASNLPKYQAPKLDYSYEAPNVAQAIQTYQNIKTQQAQTDNIRANTKRIEQQTVNLGLDEAIKNIDRQLKEINKQKGIIGLSWMPAQLSQAYRKNQSAIESLNTGTMLKKSQTTFTDSKTAEINRLLETRAKLLSAQVGYTISNTGLNRWKSGLLIQQMEGIKSTMDLQKANIQNVQERTNLLKKQNMMYYPNSVLNFWDTFKGRRNDSWRLFNPLINGMFK